MLTSLIFVSIGYIFCVLYTDLMFEIQVFSKRNDAKALNSAVAYYERVFTAPFAPVGVLLAFGVANGVTMYNLMNNSLTTLKIISLILLIAPQVVFGVYLLPIEKTLHLSTTTKENRIKGLKTLFFTHIAMFISIFGFFLTCLVEYN